MNAPETVAAPLPALQAQWPAPLTAREWDQRFPGILDGVQLLAGAANVILQLSRLPVGRGVFESRVDSGNLFKHPYKRFRTTITYLAVAMLGTPEEKIAYRQAVNRSHAQVQSTADSPVKYNAFDPELQLWVASCICWGIVDTNKKFGRSWTREKLEQFYRLAAPLGTTLQVRAGMWPADLAAFETYWEQGLGRLAMDDQVRGMLTAVADREFLPPALRIPGGRFLTAGFLPPPLRTLMHFDWDAARQQRFDRRIARIDRINRLLPRFIRQAPFTLAMWDFRRRLRKGLALT